MLSTAPSPSLQIPAGGRLFSADRHPNLSGQLKITAYGVRLADWRRHAARKQSIQEYSIGVPVIQHPGKIPDLVEEHSSSSALEASGAARIERLVAEVKMMLSSMGDGEITVSAYDTAWVALVPDMTGSGGPQFPSSLQWIADNQLADGSWGDDYIFTAHDRIINTLACVIALKSWSLSPEGCERGLEFLSENMWRLSEEDAEHVTIGFEVAFPSLMEVAKELGLDVPFDDPALQNIYAMRHLKLSRIPKDVMHQEPTTLLHSLEGMPGLDWSRLLQLQSNDGSFLFSPASTAYALMQTGDHKCLAYLQRAVDRFNGGVPNVYPVDLFEHIWVVDRLERLGISRYFEAEIKECIDYVYKYWDEDGICWARNSAVQDVDDTAMGFRLLRLHGYDVSPDVLRHFEKDGEFFCFAGQSNQAVTGMYNVNRASQVAYPGEEILNRAKNFSYKFLREKQAAGQLLDKWIITKDLPGEVEYALDFPFYASLPRVETRLFLDQYGGGSDVWIGKTLYRMPYVNNDVYLELAKSDYNRCQLLHQHEWLGFRRWYVDCELAEFGVSRDSLLKAYYLAAASIFSPELSLERLGWARTAVVAEAVSSYFGSDSCTSDVRRAFVQEFTNCYNDSNGDAHARMGGKRTEQWPVRLASAIRQLLDRIAADAQPAHGGRQPQQQQTRQHLQRAWEEWMGRWRKAGEEEEDEDGHMRWWSEGRDETALLLVKTVEACAERTTLGASEGGEEFGLLARHVSSICHRLQRAASLIPQDETKNSTRITEDEGIESDLQKLIQCVVQGSGNLNNETRQTFLTITKSFYYAAHCPPKTLSSHIAKVLFQPVA